MKNAIYISLCFSLTLLTTTLNAQTLVNKAWQDTTGNPKDTLNLLLGAKDGAGNYITVGNTYETNDSEFLLITKYSNTGTKIWQNHITTPGATRLIATDLNVSGSSFYIAATDYDSLHNRSSMFTFKCNESTGAIIWSIQYAAITGYTVPAAIREDNTHSVYVTGTEQVTSTDYRMLVIKYDSTGTQKWVNHYDTSGFYNGAVGMVVNTSTSKVTIAGFSGTTFGSWAIVTANFNTSTGALGTVSRVANPSGSFISHPVAIARDISDNLFVLGACEVSGPNIDYKLIKYDSLFNQVWVKTWGGKDSLDDEPSYMVADSFGNLLITGYTTHTNGHIDLAIMKYSNSGTLLWSNTINNNNASATHIAKGTSLAFDNSGNVYVTGQIYNGSNYDIETAEFNASGSILWEKAYDAGGASNDIGMNVSLDNLNNAYVGGTITTGTTTKYITLSYQPLTITRTFVRDTSGASLYGKGNLIVRFDRSVLNLSVINNDGKIYGTPSQFLTSSFDSAFERTLTNQGINTKLCYMKKLAPNYHTWDTVLMSKTGDTVRIAPFWSSFLLIYTTTTSDYTVRDSLNKFYPNVKYASINYILHPTCNCSTLCADDPYYESNQFALHDDSVGDFANGNIHAEGAWAIETGKPFVKVGIFDTGIEWGHEDFTRSDNSSKIIGGKDYVIHNAEILSIPSDSADFNGHGTGIAGVIGALRNNNVGIAGVAGGNYCGTSPNAGVSLYSFGVESPTGSGGAPEIDMDADISAMVDALGNDSAINYSSMDVMNFSQEVVTNGADSLQELKEKFYYAFRLGKIVVVSAGNVGNQNHLATIYPAAFSDDWLICVGGSDQNGDFYSGSLTSPNMDVIAPYLASMDYSADNVAGGTSYKTWSGTSFSAPFVTGLAGLLLSHLNNPTAQTDAKNLAPEDVEQIAQRTTFFDSLHPYTPPYDPEIGWGRVDLAGAMQMADTTHARLLHFDSHTSTTTYTVSKITGSDIGVQLLDNAFCDTCGRIKAGGYKAEVWEVSGVVHHHIVLKPKETIRAAWPRSSSSLSYALYDSSTGVNQVVPYEEAFMSSTNPDTSTATIWGYYYKLKDTVTSTVIGWYPSNPTDTTHRPKLAYTVYLDTTTHTVIPTEISVGETTPEFSFAAFPNPARDMVHILLTSSDEEFYTIKLYDPLGRAAKTLFIGQTSRLSEDYNIGNLEAGMYFILASSANKVRTVKLSIVK